MDGSPAGSSGPSLSQATRERVLALPCWKAPREPVALGGGITNVNIRLRDGDRDYVVRLGADIPEHGVMRFNELAISRAAHAAGLSPAVHHAEPGVIVLEYVDAAPLSERELQEPAMLSAVIELVRRLHRDVTRELAGPILTFWVFHVLRDYTRTLRERGSAHVPLLSGLSREAERLEEAVGTIDLVLGHNDLLPANILRGTERLWLIDWEYGGFNSPLFDLGGLASNAGLDAGAERAMLCGYLGAPPDAATLRAYRAMKCASLLRETLWSMVSELTSRIEFDYAAYTADNLARYRRAFSDFDS